MKAIVQDRFGPPEVLRLADTDLPEVGADDVLVRVHAAALNPADWHILRGDPLVARLMGVGLTRPKARVAGIDAAGVVEAVGANVRGLRNGDEVLGFCRGAFAEYACAAADLVVPEPADLTFEQAAAVPIAATTALRGTRQNRQELLAVTGLIQDGKLLPVVDRTYPLAEAVEGLRTVEQGHARGKIVVTVA